MSIPFNQNPSKFYVTVDCILLGFKKNILHVLLYKRHTKPQQERWSLIGGFVEEEEGIHESAVRVVSNCIGVNRLFIEQIGAYGEVRRTSDIHERLISIAYYAMVNTENIEEKLLEQQQAIWVKVSEVPKLVFDHNQMLNEALSILKIKMAVTPIAFNLLPEKFTLPQLQNLYEAIYEQSVDKRNFRKKLNMMNILDKLVEKDKKHSKRGAYYYVFNEDKYRQLVQEGFVFSL